MNNEAYACQYLDHHVADHPRHRRQSLMSRQNLAQGGGFPWAAHGCLEGAAGFATDFRQIMGPGASRPGRLRASVWREPALDAPAVRDRLRGAAVEARSRSRPARRRTGPSSASTSPIIPAASADADLARRRRGRARRRGFGARARSTLAPRPSCSLLHDAPAAVADAFDDSGDRGALPRAARMSSGGRRGCCRSSRRDERHSRHVVLRDKERRRRAPSRRAAAQRRRRCCRTRRRCAPLLDARRVRRPAHDRQHLVPQAVFRLARSLQHHARQRPAHAGRYRRANGGC